MSGAPRATAPVPRPAHGPPPEEGPWPLFVYGTLRPGEELWPVLEPGVVERREACVAGALFLHEGEAWPVLCVDDRRPPVPPDPTIRCTGDLCTVVDPGVLGEVAGIELTSGYEARWLHVWTPDDRPLGLALTFVWPWDDYQRGRRVASGDWRRRDEPEP